MIASDRLIEPRRCECSATKAIAGRGSGRAIGSATSGSPGGCWRRTTAPQPLAIARSSRPPLMFGLACPHAGRWFLFEKGASSQNRSLGTRWHVSHPKDQRTRFSLTATVAGLFSSQPSQSPPTATIRSARQSSDVAKDPVAGVDFGVASRHDFVDAPATRDEDASGRAGFLSACSGGDSAHRLAALGRAGLEACQPGPWRTCHRAGVGHAFRPTGGAGGRLPLRRAWRVCTLGYRAALTPGTPRPRASRHVGQLIRA